MGEIGRRREAFCRQYSRLKKSRLPEAEDQIRQAVSAAGKTISCSKGCGHCCSLFVIASLQECECLVYHLYNNRDELIHFIESFQSWRKRTLNIEDTFRRINHVQALMVAGQATEEDLKTFDADCDTYAAQANPCPFLKDDACSVYAVRPYVCAGVVSASPREWCQPRHPRQSEIEHFKLTINHGEDAPYFALPASGAVCASMPVMVYRLLTEGYRALASIKGLEDIETVLNSDPETQAWVKERRHRRSQEGGRHDART
jgi:Fe-S-cluster containining protein